ncbi:MAG: DEAD/DEAH box helicase, partial [Bacteroides sp.]|nr:DEAD/DEAH box helicase [Bacteroides sp.]
MRFDELDLSDDILDALDAMNFNECTPIQEHAIPVILDGRDLIAVAQTGTGKTAAYLLPVIDRLVDEPVPEDAVNCIVMAPTRELAQQIDRQMEGFAYFVPINSVAIYGGTDGATFAQQQRGLKLGADVVIATPGRLLAHLNMGYVDLSKVSYFILDEADRMLDMGFFDDIMQIVKQLPESRQTLMFSATMPPKIQQLAQAILKNPAEVKLAVSRPTEKIDQSAYVCYDPQKTPILKYLLKTFHSKRVIVFSASKLAVKELTRELRRSKIKTGEMHSDLEQNER